jgi:hypothetical protein
VHKLLHLQRPGTVPTVAPCLSVYSISLSRIYNFLCAHRTFVQNEVQGKMLIVKHWNFTNMFIHQKLRAGKLTIKDSLSRIK